MASKGSCDTGARAIPWVRYGGRLLWLAPIVLYGSGSLARRWLDDDGFINLRIVRNILEGNGPVFNMGERIEAGTSPLWLAVVALLGALGVRLEWAATFGGIALACLGLLLAMLGAKRMAGAETSRHDPHLPLGALVIASIPAAWDYASSGLETGLTFAWLGATYLLLAGFLRAEPRKARVLGFFFVAGLGVLVRPELALYSTLWIVVAWLRLAGAAPWDVRPRMPRLLLALACAIAVPLAYQIFRMGYYGAITPNTALAKEAFFPHVAQGRRYFDNFFLTYAVYAPILALLVVSALELRRVRTPARWSHGRLALRWAAVPVALVHAYYIVRMGGDYMHGRMWLPPLFALLLPVMSVPVCRLGEGRLRLATRLATAAVVLSWSVYCAARLRVPEENQHGIGDERGWYARMAKKSNPVLLRDFAQHPFYASGEKLMGKIARQCPTVRGGPGKPCRLLLELDPDEGFLQSSQATYPLSPTLHAGVHAAVPSGAVGIVGYMLPSTVHVIDIHGLGDPLAARLTVDKRGRPGHEKRLTNPWVVARFADTTHVRDPEVKAARTAMSCGDLALVEETTRGTLSFKRFVGNVRNAYRLQRVRTPIDTFDAESLACGTRRYVSESTASTGGQPYRYACPDDGAMTGLWVSLHEKESSVACVRPACTTDSPGQAARCAAGKRSSELTKLTCPDGQQVMSLRGHADRLLREIQLGCANALVPFPPGGPTLSQAQGYAKGEAFSVSCPPGSRPVGVAGRAGDLIDSVGVLCKLDVPTSR